MRFGMDRSNGTGDIEVEDLITHRLPLKDTAEGFRMLIEGADSLKIIIKPQER